MIHIEAQPRLLEKAAIDITFIDNKFSPVIIYITL